jgi:trimeric autotransporter adhesin
MGNRFYYGMPSTQAFQAMNALDDDVQAKSAAATTAAQSAASSATQAGNARDAALAAWQASTAPNEQLAAMSKQFHAGAIVDVFLYDTSRDSDGGAWRKRCRHTSWENETLAPGKWLGQSTNWAAAWAIPGAASGDYYQDLSTGAFYQLTTPNVATGIARGNTREFPALALIVAESARVVIYDATQPALPMWMVFVGWSGGEFLSNALPGGGVTGIRALNGCISVSNSDIPGGNWLSGLWQMRMVSDEIYRYTEFAFLQKPSPLASRNRAETFRSVTGPNIVNRTAYAVAMTVLANAPADPATGLPTPTVAVATLGGVSIIKHDGTVVNWMTSYGYASKVDISSTGRLIWSGGGGIAYRAAFRNSLPTSSPDNTTDGWYEANSIPQRPGLNSGADGDVGLLDKIAPMGDPASWVFGSRTTGPLQLYKANPASPTKSMVTFISAAYNSGWQVGDARGAWLADTTAETISASGELVTNGTFNVDTTGWFGVNGPTLAVDATGVTVTKPTSTDVSLAQDITTTIGKTYLLKYDVTGTSGNYIVGVNDSAGNSVTGTGYVSTVGTGRTLTFTATTTRTTIYLQKGGGAGSGATFDNISLKLAEPDRSVKNAGLIVNGSITKAAAATGAQLVGYTGFSAANYLEQPYNANLDFGTGDFCYMGWIYVTDMSSYIGLLHRSQLGQGGGLYIQLAGGSGAVIV